MKTKIYYSIIISTLMLFASCTSNNKENSTSKAKDSSEHNEHHHAGKAEQLVLNDGKKWKVNPEMMIHLTKMKNDLAQFEKSEKMDYKTLAAKLSESIDSLTSSCTMEGKAHDELHKWLLPFIELIDEFSKTTDIKENAIIFSKIKNSFIQFDEYFE